MKKITLSLLLGLLMQVSAFSQTVTTFTDGTPDDAIVLDGNGNIYCSNYVGDTVFKFTPTGVGSSFVTGLNTPNGLAFNSNSQLYVCDGVGNTIYKYDLNGTQLASYSNPGHPSGIIRAHDSETMIFTEYSGSTINRLDPDETIHEFSSDPLLVGPVGLAYGDNNELYVANYNNRKIYKVISDGSLEYIATVGGVSNLGFMAYAQGLLWATVLGEHKIYKINPNVVDGVTLFAGSTGGSMDGDISEATFNQPNGIAFNAAGDIMYVTDFGTKNLRVISGITVLGNTDFDLKKNHLELFPNPTNDTLNININIEEGVAYSIKVYDLIGKPVLTSEASEDENFLNKTVDVTHLAAGVYFVRLNANGQFITKKFIKK